MGWDGLVYKANQGLDFHDSKILSFCGNQIWQILHIDNFLIFFSRTDLESYTRKFIFVSY